MTKGMELPNQEKNQNAWRKGNGQILENIESRHHQTSRDENKFKKYLRRMRKLLKIQTIVQEPHKRNKHLGSLLHKIFGTILQVDEGRTNGPENKKTNDNA